MINNTVRRWVLLAFVLQISLAFHAPGLGPRWKRNVTYLAKKSSKSKDDSVPRKKSFGVDFPQGLTFPNVDIKNLPLILQGYASNVLLVAGEWALAYADLSPETASTPAGKGFLSTNIAYLVSGTALYMDGDYALGSLTLISGFVSFWYHFEQLQSTIKTSNGVQVALLVDYSVALTTIGFGLAYVFEIGLSNMPTLAIICCGEAFVFLFAGWFPPFGVPAFRPKWAGSGAPYIFVHSSWHLLSATTLYFIGEAHLEHSGIAVCQCS
jgi:hypothetical protein